MGFNLVMSSSIHATLLPLISLTDILAFPLAAGVPLLAAAVPLLAAVVPLLAAAVPFSVAASVFLTAPARALSHMRDSSSAYFIMAFASACRASTPVKAFRSFSAKFAIHSRICSYRPGFSFAMIAGSCVSSSIISQLSAITSSTASSMESSPFSRAAFCSASASMSTPSSIRCRVTKSRSCA